MFTDMLGKIVAILTSLPDNMSGSLLDLMEKLAGPNGKECFEELKKFLRKETCWGSSKNPYLCQIATENLVAIIGKRTLAKAKKLFSGYLDPNFANYGTDTESEAKPEMLFEVFEQVKDGTFAEIFGAFGVELDKLCLSQDQIITFVENHAHLLHPQGYATFFLFRVGEKFFVALVFRCDGGQLGARVRRLSYGNVWRAGDRIRFVFPQL